MDKKILKDVIYYLSDKQGFVASVVEKDFHLTRKEELGSGFTSSHFPFYIL